MKKILIIIVLFIYKISIAQESNICKCNALTKSEDSIKKFTNYNVTTISKKDALKPPFHFISVKYLKSHANSGEMVDSVDLKIKNFLKLKNIDHDDDLLHYQVTDSIKKAEFAKTFGIVPKPLIVKSGKLHHSIAILYSTDNYYKSKYYLALSTDDGKTWKNYYTGLVRKFNYILKSNSQVPLWKDSEHIQIEADIVRMIQPMNFPGPQEQFETLKNNALLTLNLKEILKDSDNDGFNDLDETLELFTNPLSSDTDYDGISDYEDPNPKYKSTDNDFNRLLLAILYGNYPVVENSDPRQTEFIVNLKTFEKDFKNPDIFFHEKEMQSSDPFDFSFIITDNQSLKTITPIDKKIIFLTSQEFAKYKKNTFMNLYTSHYSKLFPCDDAEDTYIFVMDNVWMGHTYLIKKIPDGWFIKIVSGWQS
ncbi:hypothetical protein SAMN05421856_10979 [Chryseobacterium taichungense]|uniref:Uncharacterized protein n=1 Tax=Chryseobacterium taichungense TaxID=295069 RepID=A0A1H8CK46_9FLAO|nr:hypothetical protein [Chryseobacterium taichungense]SEM94457.1 hypothetical protein SAMN05421856_10979 [Chryseobacterium taichungense]